jgi:hypothetical protein
MRCNLAEDMINRRYQPITNLDSKAQEASRPLCEQRVTLMILVSASFEYSTIRILADYCGPVAAQIPGMAAFRNRYAPSKSESCLATFKPLTSGLEDVQVYLGSYITFFTYVRIFVISNIV